MLRKHRNTESYKLFDFPIQVLNVLHNELSLLLLYYYYLKSFNTSPNNYEGGELKTTEQITYFALQ